MSTARWSIKKKQLTPGTIAAVARLRGGRDRLHHHQRAAAIGDDADRRCAWRSTSRWARSTAAWCSAATARVDEHHVIDPRASRAGCSIWSATRRSIAGCSPTTTGMPATERGRSCRAASASPRTRSRSSPTISRDLLDHADKITFVSDDAALLAGLHERATARVRRRGDGGPVADLLSRRDRARGNKGDGISALAEAMACFAGAIRRRSAIRPMTSRCSNAPACAIAMGNATDAAKKRRRRDHHQQ